MCWWSEELCGTAPDAIDLRPGALMRFALHFEVKQPADKFPTNKDQAANYALRAKCWASSPPKSVVSHVDATTVLLCSALNLAEYSPHPLKFGAVITFEEIAATFPQAT